MISCRARPRHRPREVYGHDEGGDDSICREDEVCDLLCSLLRLVRCVRKVLMLTCLFRGNGIMSGKQYYIGGAEGMAFGAVGC
jgi:hypothetical protein